jgi:YjbE family integral membrane protein
MFDGPYMVGLLEIIWIDLVLSGDNAVLIALACRRLPNEQRRKAIIFGTGAAIGLRVVFAIVVTHLLSIAYLKVIGAFLLMWIAVKLILPEDADENAEQLEGSTSLSGAIKTIVVADLVMSLDNVLGIGAAAKGHTSLIVIGLLISVPLIIWGSTLILRLLDNHPWIVYAGGAVLGYVAGEMLITDPAVVPLLENVGGWIHWAAPALGIAIVLGVGSVLRSRVQPRASS